LLFGTAAVERIARDPAVETVVAGIVGAAGLKSTWAALEAGKRVAFANKETLVVAGPLVTALAAHSGGSLVPVDSEHSAVFQALQAGNRSDLRRIVLTASGGPFRGYSAAQMRDVTPKMAMAHPTWAMGPKVTVDSATMMNKALEMIEAKWLFGLDVDQIGVMIHPQSIVHSFVEFRDGSVVAQLSPPDMRLPIQYALTWPERWEGISPRINWSSAMSLEFTPPDLEAFPALGLGYEVARRGGTCGAVLNAANEIAVERFLAGQLRFTDIPRLCRAVLEAHDFDPSPSLSQLLEMDQWTRAEARSWRAE
jgi:1-deoxy-D-xylulose-5-phosphate reductoisomerase